MLGALGAALSQQYWQLLAARFVLGLAVVALAFFLLRVPETRDRTLEEIESEVGAEPRRLGPPADEPLSKAIDSRLPRGRPTPRSAGDVPDRDVTSESIV